MRAENIVLIKNIDADIVILLITRRPSSTIWGIASKLLSSKTRFAAFLAASLPDAIAIEQSASLKARTSLTPSPVIATVWPCCFKATTIAFFCCGVTLPKTEYLFKASVISSEVERVVAST